MEFLRRFAGSDPRSFAMAGGIRNLPDAEIPAAFDRLAASGKLTRRQKLHLLRNLSGEKCRRALGERYAVFYRQLEDEILDDFADPGYMGAVGDLLSCTREDPARHEALLARLAPDKRAGAAELLAQDPRPGYHADPARVYRIAYAGKDMHFTVADGVLTVTDVTEINNDR